MDIQVPDHNAKSYAYSRLCVNYSLHHFFKAHEFSILLLYFKLNKKLKIFLEITDYSKFIGGFNKIKLCQDKLEMIKVRYPILSFL